MSESVGPGWEGFPHSGCRWTPVLAGARGRTCWPHLLSRGSAFDTIGARGIPAAHARLAFGGLGATKSVRGGSSDVCSRHWRAISASLREIGLAGGARFQCKRANRTPAAPPTGRATLVVLLTRDPFLEGWRSSTGEKCETWAFLFCAGERKPLRKGGMMFVLRNFPQRLTSQCSSQ